MTELDVWARYRKNRATVNRITLAKFHMPEFWIEIEDVLAMTTSELSNLLIESQKKFQSEVKELQAIAEVREKELSAQVEAGEITETDKSAYLLSAPELIVPSMSIENRSVISAWNLTDPATGEPLELPLGSWKSLLALPAEILHWIDEEVSKCWERWIDAPKESGSNSETSSETTETLPNG